MKLISVIIMSMFLVNCMQRAKFTTSEPENECSIVEVDGGAIIDCNGEKVVIEDGSDGQDGVLLTRVNAPKNKCTEVADGIYVENIQNGRLFDVYLNDKCKDKDGEFCDNVVPVEDRTGQLDEYVGSGTVCWANNTQISGVKQDNGDILVYMLEFN